MKFPKLRLLVKQQDELKMWAMVLLTLFICAMLWCAAVAMRNPNAIR
ncbi:hypothetical protein [Runella sp.]